MTTQPTEQQAGGPAVSSVGATAQELAERGLAQALAAALWEAEPGARGPLPPLPMTVPSLADDDDRTYKQPSREELERMAMFDIPVETSVIAKAKKAAKKDSETPPAWVSERLDEMQRLQQRQQDHVEKLYAENRTLRGGELAHALAPILLGLTKLYDLTAKLIEADGPDSSAAMLQKQLLQVLDNAGSVQIFSPEPGSPFDTTRQRGVGVVDTEDPALDGRVAATVRPGFVHFDGTVVRVAEVEVTRMRADRTIKTHQPSAS